MSLNEKLKSAVDQVDLDRRIAELKGQAGELARQHGDKVEEVLDKIESTVDARTKGKYADQLAAAHRKVSEGVAKVAEQPPADRGPQGEQPSQH
jgi:hypothetical protein